MSGAGVGPGVKRDWTPAGGGSIELIRMQAIAPISTQ
jgi:hypothetical protein